MLDGITLITPTGDRPKTLALTVQYMLRQVVKFKQWLVVNDGTADLPDALTSLPEVTVINRVRSKSDPSHTLPINLLTAIPHIKHDKIMIIEDDDWYDQSYLAFMLWLMRDGSELVGQSNSLYYHIPSARYMYCNNTNHASLCQTGFTSRMLNLFEACCNECVRKNSAFVDIKLWQQPAKKQLDKKFPRYCVGMKGLPGRTSNTIGHTRHRSFTQDIKYDILSRAIGEDVALYKEWLHESSKKTKEGSIAGSRS